jgi:pSer/pThr/pTyr-binding forkhead associated (FHA) protein
VIITLEGGKVLLTDLGSTNGTYVNAKRIQQSTLKAGDEVFIGNAVLEFNYQ